VTDPASAPPLDPTEVDEPVVATKPPVLEPVSTPVIESVVEVIGS
jgi:hypothetical protein